MLEKIKSFKKKLAFFLKNLKNVHKNIKSFINLSNKSYFQAS